MSRVGVTGRINLYARTAEHVMVALGTPSELPNEDLKNVVQVTSGVYDCDITVYGGESEDDFVIENRVDTTNRRITLNGLGGDDLLYADFADGVPEGTVALTFHGGAHGSGGDTVRIAGDGVTTGGQYHPSSTTAHAGTVTVQGFTLDFTGVEPVIVHGLPDFQVVTPDDPADLAVDMIELPPASVPDLVLHVLTIDGVISWQQKGELRFTKDALLSTKHAGRAIAISGNTLVVGADLADAAHGVVYVYTWSDSESQWVEQAKLYPSDRSSAGRGLGFGRAVAIDGDVLVVGAPLDSTNTSLTGAVYIYGRSDGLWQLETKLWADDAALEAEFGEAVAISGTTVLVGAPVKDTVYVFARANGVWRQQQKLQDQDPADSAFGAAVSIYGSTAAVGAPLFDASGQADAGQVTVYTRDNHGWRERATLTPADAQPDEKFGSALAMYDEWIVAGAPYWEAPLLALGGKPAQDEQGRAFVFEGSGATWTRVARLTADGGLPESEALQEGKAGDHFGASVAIGYVTRGPVATRSVYVVVGAPDYDGTSMDQGAAYAFYRLPDQGSKTGPTWTRSTGESGSGKLLAQYPAGSDPQTGNEPADQFTWADKFGTSVAIGGGRIVIGMPGYNENDADEHIDYWTDGSPPETLDENGQPVRKVEHGKWVKIDALFGRNDQEKAKLRGSVFERTGPTLILPLEGWPERWSAVDFTDGWTRVSINVLRSDVGAVRTYTTDGIVPAYTLARMRAEVLTNDIPADPTCGYGAQTLYDAASRTLFVGDPGHHSIVVYINEGLYWRPVQTLTRSSAGFATDFDVDGDWLVVSAPQANEVYLYERSGETWEYRQTVSGTGGFGSSVAISGGHVVVGMPTAEVKYQSVNSADPNYWLNLNQAGPEPTCPDPSAGPTEAQANGWLPSAGENPGAAVVYTRFSGTWNLDRLLMPSESEVGLPEDTSSMGYNDPDVPLWNKVWVENWGELGIGLYDFPDEGNGPSITLGPYMWVAVVGWSSYSCHQYIPNNTADPFPTTFSEDADGDAECIVVGTFATEPAVTAQLYHADDVDPNDGDHWFDYGPGRWKINDNDEQSLKVYPWTQALAFDDSGGDEGYVYSGWSADAPKSVYFAEWQGDGYDFIANDVDHLYVGSARDNSLPRYNYYSELADAQWGTSVDIVGNTIVVGSPTKGRVAVYDLFQPDYSRWTVQVGSFTDKPLRPSYTYDPADRPNQGSEFAMDTADHFFAGAPDGESAAGRAWSFTESDNAWSTAAYVRSPSHENGDLFGDAHTMVVSGDRMIVGAPGEDSAGAAFLYDSDGADLNRSFQPFDYDSEHLAMRNDPNPTLAFGYGPAIISEGHYLVGTGNTGDARNKVYNFRQRGPAWTPLAANDLLMPAPIPTAKLGSSVAIDGNTAVIGAPDYDDRGAVLVFINTAGTDVWNLQATVQPKDIGLHDQFGSSVGLSGDLLVVGAPGKGNGAAYVFQRLGDVWTQRAEWKGQQAGDDFGSSVDLYAETAIVGAPGRDRAYIYNSGDGIAWWSQQTLTGSGGFGTSVALHEYSAIIGAPAGNSNTGAALVYRRSGTVWTLEGTLTATGGWSGDRFGQSVDLSGDYAVVGAPGALTGMGSAFAFSRTGGTWLQQSEFDLAIRRAVSASYTLHAVVIPAPFNGDQYRCPAAGTSGVTEPAWPTTGGGTVGDGTVTWPCLAAVPDDDECFGPSVTIDGERIVVGA